MTAALAGVGVTTFAQDGSRQPTQYALGAALGAPRYPSNIYYNASNWPDQLNEYNTLYVRAGVSIGNGETGRCGEHLVHDLPALRRRPRRTCWRRSRGSCWATYWTTTRGSATRTSPT